MSERVASLTCEELTPAPQKLPGSQYSWLGYLGGFLGLTGRQPASLAPFMEMTDALENFLPDQLAELGTLNIAVLERASGEGLAETFSGNRLPGTAPDELISNQGDSL